MGSYFYAGKGLERSNKQNNAIFFPKNHQKPWKLYVSWRFGLRMRHSSWNERTLIGEMGGDYRVYRNTLEQINNAPHNPKEKT